MREEGKQNETITFSKGCGGERVEVEENMLKWTQDKEK